MMKRIGILSILLAAAALSGSAFGAIVLSDAEWMSGTIDAQVTLTNIPGDPGLLLSVNKTGSGGIDAIRRDFGGADLSARGTAFEVELENPGTLGYNIQAFAQSGGWAWKAQWLWLGAGQTITYSVTLTNPAIVDRVGFQFFADAGQYSVKIKGGIVDFSPSDPNPKDGGTVGVISTGNRLYWTNHTVGDGVAGSNGISELFISTDANDLFTNPKTTKINGLTNYGDVMLGIGKKYGWGVKTTDPDGGAVYTSPVWKFEAVQRVPSTRYEAEFATIVSGDASPEIRNVAAASGGKVVWTNWTGTNRGSFAWDVMAPADGNYNLTVHYAIDGTGSRSDPIRINGIGGDVSFPGTSGLYADTTIPVTLKKGLNTFSVGTSWGGISYDYFELNFDDLTATNPSPKVDDVVLVGGNKLSWSRHSVFDPKYTSDTKCTVYLGTTAPDPLLPHYGYSAIATDIFASTIPVTLDWGNNYYWVVDSTTNVDPNTNVHFPGYVWKFTTVDPKPVITLDATKTVRRTVPVVFKPTVTDLGKPGLTYAWTLTSGPAGVVIGDICADTTALNPQFAFTKVGAHTLMLSVTDGSANVSTASINVDVIEYYRALRLECEDGTIIPGDTAPEIRLDANASANRLIWSNWTGTDRGSFVVDVNLPNLAGTYDMVFHYRVDGTGARADNWSINGTQQYTTFPGTNAVFDDYVWKNVTLVNGKNEFKMTTSWGGMSYDYIEFPTIKAPLAAYDPKPGTWTTAPASLQKLSWRVDPNGVNSIITSTVYLGTAKPDFTKPNYGMTKIAGDTGTTASVSGLVKDTTYFWLVEYTDNELPGNPFRSATWQFTTVSPCVYFPLIGDLNQDCTVNVDDLMILTGAWMAPTNGYLLEQFADMAAHWLLCTDPVTGLPGPCGL
jgi:hypothetical protein